MGNDFAWRVLGFVSPESPRPELSLNLKKPDASSSNHTMCHDCCQVELV
jgi:hypothetical protein